MHLQRVRKGEQIYNYNRILVFIIWREKVRFNELAGLWRVPEQMFGDLASLCL